MEFRDLPDHKELLGSRDLRGRKGLLVQWARLEQLDLPGLLARRALWDLQVRKDRRDRKVHRALLAPLHLEPIQMLQWLV